MKYNELINFEPITNVIQLKDANEPLFAEELVRTFVASEAMEECFTKLIIPHLQFNYFNDNKALMIVGNYGTGKSHMMSVISALAEDANNVPLVTNEVIKKSAPEIAGKFKAVRIEAGAAQNSLDNIILKNEVESKLQEWKIDYQFPDFASITNYKSCIEEMMAAFNKKYPGQGILIVVDELLEYLRTKDDHALFRDLGFFRQLAESCKDTKLRVIVGMQESVFDSPYFKFAADVLNKIKDRTQLVTIKKDDIKYVVAERLLKKTASQKNWIRIYLEKFKPYYSNLTSDFENFVSLFPLHPSYIDSFSKMVRVEKREVLKSVSNALRAVINEEVLEDTLDLITIDKYWNTVANDAALNAYEGIKEVKDCNVQLQSKIRQIKPASYISMAERIINALCVQRLENSDISIALGLTSRELKDNLCLYNEMVKDMGDTEEDLITLIDSTLQAIMKAVNGQYIEKTDGDQYFININKTYDFDAAINAKMEHLTEDDLNWAYYNVLKISLECSDADVFMNNKIWDHELQFIGHKMFRKGWLFFGIPNERPTAVPEKDFYIFFIPPFNTPRYKNVGKMDELIVKIASTDKDFDASLRYYAATSIMANSTSSNYKSTFLNKADQTRKKLTNWITQNFFDNFIIMYEGKEKSPKTWTNNVSLREISGISSNETLTFREQFNAVSSYCLTSNFENVAPNYPKFSIKITESNMPETLKHAFNYVVSGTGAPDNTAAAVLNGLGILNNSTLKVSRSCYANWIITQVNSKDDGVVLRQDEVLEYPHDEFQCMKQFRLEKEFVAIILAALVNSGDIILNLRGKKYDASNMRDLLAENINGVCEFASISRPKDWNPAVIKALLVLFDQPEGKFSLIKSGQNEVIQDIQTENVKIIDELATSSYELKDGITFFGKPISTDSLNIDSIKNFIDRQKESFESLRQYDNCGKLKNLKISAEELEELHKKHDIEKRIVLFFKKAKEFENTYYQYFESARLYMPSSKKWHNDYEQVKNQAYEIALTWDISKLMSLQTSFESLKYAYIKEYVAMHSKARLSGQASTKYANLLHSDLVDKLTKLSRIEILSKATFEDTYTDLTNNLKECNNLKEEELLKSPVCPHCSFNPGAQGEDDASFKLTQIEEKLEKLLSDWTTAIVNDLKDPFNQQSIKLLSSSESEAVNELLASGELPHKLTDEFVSIVDKALKGLVKKPVKKDSVCSKLLGDGKPLSVKELKENFDQFIKDISSGEDEEKIRIVLE